MTNQHRLIVCNIMSLDGYFEGPGKNVMDLFEYRLETYPADESFDAYNAARLHAADVLLLGRTTYEQFKGYWPSVADDPDSPPLEQEISGLLGAIEKIVISDSLTPENTEPWHGNTRIVRRADAHEQIAKLKSHVGTDQMGGDILIFGSRTLWNDLLGHGLVDELHLLIAPAVLGTGTPMFDSKPSASFRLIDTQAWEGSGIVLARYEVLQGRS
ncbi:MAG: dihydrofolate reductase family protein [Coriobacteriia bacterium]|nr:dihydrofolate reductase family protein [Coriobacteriia bacterium]